MRRQFLSGFLCLLLQATLIGWIPAVIWARYSRKQDCFDSCLHHTCFSLSAAATSVQTVRADALSLQARLFYDDKHYSAAIRVLKKMLVLIPGENKTHFDLACCYSLTHNTKAFKSLAKAVEHGYTNFEKIRLAKALEWMRNQPKFAAFLKNGYKISVGHP